MPRKKKTEDILETDKKPKDQEALSYAHGRRKTAVALVRLHKNRGGIIVNEKPIGTYFPGEVSQKYYLKPFELTDTVGVYSATIKVSGSGKSGQLGAAVHGLARALVEINPDFKPILKKAGLIKRDPRAKERRKYGLAQKARKGKQSPKR